MVSNQVVADFHSVNARTVKAHCDPRSSRIKSVTANDQVGIAVGAINIGGVLASDVHAVRRRTAVYIDICDGQISDGDSSRIEDIDAGGRLLIA